MSNYSREELNTDEETDIHLTSTDFVAASALLDDDDGMEEEDQSSHFVPATKKLNLSKLTEGIKNKVCVHDDISPKTLLNILVFSGNISGLRTNRKA